MKRNLGTALGFSKMVIPFEVTAAVMNALSSPLLALEDCIANSMDRLLSGESTIK
jgi:hypothetical protein